MFSSLQHRHMVRSAGVFTLAAVGVAMIPATSQAYLGSFGPNDGYHPQYGFLGGDVTYYNAGQSGANAGGGGLAAVPADSGLWKLQTPVGAYFDSAANRAAFAASYPNYVSSSAVGTVTYMVGGHFPGRNSDGYNLAFRNFLPAGTGPARYRYSIDTYDTGGNVPASVTSGAVSTSFYFSPNPADPAPSDGSASGIKFTMSLLDSSANIGFQWGYARDNTVMWRDSPTSLWNNTSVVADQTNWDGVKFNMDLTADTFGIDYYDASSNTWSSMVPSGTPMGMAMTNLTHLDWQLEDNVTLAGSPQVGAKNYFDDFSFVIPEPASLSLAMFGAAAMFRRSRRG